MILGQTSGHGRIFGRTDVSEEYLSHGRQFAHPALRSAGCYPARDSTRLAFGLARRARARGFVATPEASRISPNASSRKSRRRSTSGAQAASPVSPKYTAPL